MTVAYKAGIREVSENYNDRYNIKIAHGFRKFLSTTLSNIKTADGSGRTAIDFINKEWLLGHIYRPDYEVGIMIAIDHQDISCVTRQIKRESIYTESKKTII
jgi:hypothetical protein